jgi:hypothetical protein
MCDYDNFPLLTDLEETLIGAGGEVALLAPRVLAAWYDREGSRGEGFLPGLRLACHAGQGWAWGAGGKTLPRAYTTKMNKHAEICIQCAKYAVY